MARRTILTPQAKVRKANRDAEMQHAQETCLDDLLPPEDRSTAPLPKLVSSDRRQTEAMRRLTERARVRSLQERPVIDRPFTDNDTREHHLELLQIYHENEEDRHNGNWIGTVLVLGITMSIGIMAYALF